MSSQSSFFQSRSKMRKARLILVEALLIVLSLVFLTPLVWMISTSLKKLGEVWITPIQWLPSDPQWSNYREIFEILPLASFIKNTVFVTVLATLGDIVSAVTVAYGMSRLRWRGREFVFAGLLGTMMLPGVVVLIPQFVMFFRIGWIDTFYPLIVPSWFGSAFYIFLLRQFMRGLPIELDEAARLDGASSLRILWQVLVPLCKSAIVTVAIFSGMAHYNNFMGPLLYLSSNDKFTLPLGLYWYQGRYGNFWHLVMAASTVSVLPLIVLFFVAQDQFVRGVSFSGIAGR